MRIVQIFDKDVFFSFYFFFPDNVFNFKSKIVLVWIWSRPKLLCVVLSFQGFTHQILNSVQRRISIAVHRFNFKDWSSLKQSRNYLLEVWKRNGMENSENVLYMLFKKQAIEKRVLLLNRQKLQKNTR